MGYTMRPCLKKNNQEKKIIKVSYTIATVRWFTVRKQGRLDWEDGSVSSVCYTRVRT